jgi:hypothetical protein
MIRNDLAPTLSLDGTWSLLSAAGDPLGEIDVPGCWEAQGYPKTLDGPLRYQRTVAIPAAWTGTRVLAEFDAVSYAATVWCNGQKVGEHLGLWTPFALDLTAALLPGQENVLEVEVVKPCHRLTGGLYPLRTTLAGFLPDVATSFGGIWQGVRLRMLQAGFDDLWVEADAALGRVRVRAKLMLPAGTASISVTATLYDAGLPVAAQTVAIGQDSSVDLALAVAQPSLWSPAQPTLYTLHVEMRSGDTPLTATTQRIGFRRLTRADEQLLLNDEPIYLRGILSWGWDPDRIAPWVSRSQARAEMRRVRELGFNLIKLCLFIPNQAYYEVADEEGMLLWQEWPLWLPEVTDALRGRAPAEYAGYMRLTRHHPAVVIYSLGCELDQSVDAALLRQLDTVARQSVGNVLFCDNSGSGEAYAGLPVDFSDFADYHTYGDLHYLEPMLDHWRRDWQPSRPWLFGEFCDSDGFRDRRQVITANRGQPPWWMTADNPTYTWRPEVRALAEAEQRLDAARLAHTPQDLLTVANAQSLMVRKYTLETVRKRRAVQGYVVTGLRDTPVATSGVFDDFLQSKWPAEAFRPFNDDAILCLDVGRSRIWQHGGDRPERLDPHNGWGGESVRLPVILSHSAAQAVTSGTLTWQVSAADGTQLAAGRGGIVQAIPPSFPCEIGVVHFTAPVVDAPRALHLAVHFSCAAFTCANQWPLWVYPQSTGAPGEVALYDPARRLDEEWQTVASACEADALAAWHGPVIATALDAALLAHLHGGGRVLLLQDGAGPLPARRLPFWRESLKLFVPHPLWQRFPHPGFVGLQFFGMAADAAFDTPQVEAALPEMHAFTPMLRRLDARAFTVTDYLFEAQVGQGTLVGCSLRLHGGAGAQPTGLRRNIAGRALLAGLLDHLHAERPSPT